MNNNFITKKILPVLMLSIVSLGFILLIMNEYSYARDNQPISKMKYRTISADKIDEKNNNKLITTTGTLMATDNLTDEEFNISVNSPILERVVEVYTCHEICDAISYNKRKCEVVSDWSTSLKSDVIYQSPICGTKVTTKKYRDLTMYNDNNKLGAFKLDNSFLIKIPAENKVMNLNEETAKKLNLYIVDSAYTTTPPNEEPKAGDIRITFYYASPIEYTVLGKQNNNRIEPYIRASGYSVSYAGLEKLTGQQILDTKKEPVYYAPNLWNIREISLLLIIAGIIYPTIVFCETHEKFKAKKLKMVLITTSAVTTISMLITLLLWSLYQSYFSDDVIIACIIAGSSAVCLICAILVKQVPVQKGYRRDSFSEKYGYLREQHPTFNLSAENKLNQQTYEKRQIYENPYKTKSSQQTTYLKNKNYENPYKQNDK